ncbi:MAG: aldehyde dehydrogenase family protein [Deltaproteobacteria bacterium]|nr:aldehyde dehydrogenase family protein [Deltaproteobacteria bacterium]
MADEITARLELLAKLGESLARHKDDLVAAQGQDIGAPCAIAAFEVDLAVEHLKNMAEEVPYVQGKSPYGTVAAIFPYDASPIMLARVGGAAILGGNRFRYSCSSMTPRSARILQEVVAPLAKIEAVTGMKNQDFGRRCVEDPAVRVLFISGGAAVGEIYAKEAGHFDKLFFAGPSGLPPVILFQDANLTAAVRFVVRRAFVNGGQYCTTLKRAYIHRDIYETAKKLIIEQMADIRVGDPRDPKTWIGPLKVARTRALLDRALAALKDPHFLVPYRREGEWQGPFLVETTEPPDVELFGPLLTLIPIESEAAAVETVLASRYPFLVSWFGTPPPGAKEALTKTFGMVYDNPDFLFTPLRLPFGGKGPSGWIIENHDGHLSKRDGAFMYSAELVREK